MGTDSLRIFNKILAKKLLLNCADKDEIWNSCFSKEEIYLDYYGSLAYLNGFSWEKAISNSEIFPNDEDGEVFLLLQSDQVNRIINSLQANIDHLTLMTEKEIDKITEFKNFCDRNEGFMVAYMIDF